MVLAEPPAATALMRQATRAFTSAVGDEEPAAARWQRALNKTRNRIVAALCFKFARDVTYEVGDLHTDHYQGHLAYLNKMRYGMCVTTVESVSDLAALPMWQQGDADLATDEAMRERQALRHAPEVVDALAAFWALFERTAVCVDGSGNVTERGFTLLYERAYRLLMPAEEFDAAEAARDIHDDYLNDCDGGSSLTRTAFEDGLFELSDLWTMGIDAEECATPPPRTPISPRTPTSPRTHTSPRTPTSTPA